MVWRRPRKDDALKLRKLLFLTAILCLPALARAAPAPVLVLTIDGAIGPATSDYVHRGLEAAQNDGAQLVVLKMDTPGGLSSAMREIIKDILASPVPVAAYVAPSGSRAASAGTYILYASHFAVMAPATNLGAATPIQIGAPSAPAPASEKKGKKGEQGGSTLEHKMVNDASAYIRGLAQMRGRNAKWAERAVREAVSLSATEAEKMHVVDFIADSVPALLGKLDGRKVTAAGAERTLHLADARIDTFELGWRTRLLGVITDPSIAYVLVLVGILAVIYEFSNPGLVLPGVVGAICILLGMYAFQLLPVNYAGLGLILLGIAFMVGEAFLPAFGSLGIGGLIAFVIGSIILIDGDAPGFAIPYALIGGIAAASAAFLILVVGMLVRGRRRPVVSGREEMIGASGVALEDIRGEGWARVHSETWRVHSSAPLAKGQRLRVTAIDGLTLKVVAEPGNGNGG